MSPDNTTHDDNASRLRQHRLIQFGLCLFLAALLVGLGVPYFAVPRLGLAAHLLGIMQGLFLIAIGLIWPRLRFGIGTGRLVFVLLLYGCAAAWLSNLAGAILGAGTSIVPMAAGAARGTVLQETLITAGLRSAGASLIVATALLLWGLRSKA